MYRDFYQGLRSRIKEWAAREGKDSKALKYILLTPDFFHLLCKLIFDSRVPTIEKVKVGSAVAYFVSSADVVPEAIVGPAGYIDDVSVAAYILNSILTSVNPEVLKEHWAGDGDVLENIQEILNISDELIESGMWEKIRKLFKQSEVKKVDRKILDP